MLYGVFDRRLVQNRLCGPQVSRSPNDILQWNGKPISWCLIRYFTVIKYDPVLSLEPVLHVHQGF